jgi:hypothetical protein
MSGAIPPLPQYTFMARCLVEAQGEGGTEEKYEDSEHNRDRKPPVMKVIKEPLAIYLSCSRHWTGMWRRIAFHVLPASGHWSSCHCW